MAVVTDRGRDQLRFYAIDAGAGRLVDVTAASVPLAFSADQAEVNDQATAYGLAVYRDIDGRPYAVVTRRHTTTLGIFAITVTGGSVTYYRTDLRTFPDTFRLDNGATWSLCSPVRGRSSKAWWSIR